jgi:hypothetical protein
VDEDVGPTGIDDEPKSLFAVEPFHCANGHTDTSARTKRAGPGATGTSLSDRHTCLAYTQNGGP